MKKLFAIILVLVLVFMPVNLNTALAATEDSKISELYSEVQPYIIKSIDDLQILIDNDEPYSSEDIITTPWKGKSDSHKVVVTESGWLFIQIIGSINNMDIDVYSNASLTSPVEKVYALSTGDYNKKISLAIGVYLNAGTYYYQLSRFNGNNSLDAKCYVGFMPASERIKISKITYSADKSLAKVTLDINENYYNFYKNGGYLRYAIGTVSYRNIFSTTTWGTYNSKNVLDSNKVTITKNNTYAFRVSNSDKDKYYCDVVFDIKDIVSTVYTPKILSYTKGSTKIAGRASYGNTVYVTVNTKKYTVYVGKDKTWSISVPILKTGTKIKVYAKNAAGSSSKSTYVKVK